MNTENRTIFENRLKSFLWRPGMMLLAFFVAFALDNINLLEIGTEAKVVLGLLLGELSKYLNSRIDINEEK